MGSQALAPPQVVDVTLALFAGTKTDITPSDCPEGISPDTQDGIYLPGGWISRPGLHRLFGGALAPGVQVLYEKTYVQPNNQPLTLLLTSDGNYWVENVTTNPGQAASLFSVNPGLYAQSVTAFGREYIAFSDLLHGQGVPLQYDGTNLDRVTMDGPGVSPAVADFQETLNVLASGGIGMAGTGFAIAASPLGATQVGNLVTIKTTTAHNFYPSQNVFVLGVAIAGYNGIQQVVSTPTATTFTYLVNQSGLAASGGGTVSPPTSSIEVAGPKPQINVGDNVVLSDTGSGLDNGSPAATLSGDVDTDATGFVVSWVSGSQFSTSMQGGPITINGVPAVVATVSSPTSLVLEGQVTPNQSGVAYSAALSNPANWPVVAIDAFAGNWLIWIDFSAAPSTIAITSEGAAGTVFLGGQSSPGVHQVVCMWLTRQGALTAPSPPLNFVSAGNTQWKLTDLPIGPANVVARVFAFTGAGGDNFFTIPESVTIPNPTSPTGAPIVVLATMVPDNTSTSYIVDVPDNTLFDAVAIDQIGNDLFDQRVLGPVLGFFSFASRLMCWGDYQKVENFLNMGFSGGYLWGGFTPTLTTPCGWTVLTAGGTLAFPGAAAVNTTTSTAVIATGTQLVDLTSLNNVKIGQLLTIDTAGNQEAVRVLQVRTHGTVGILANFAKTHANGVAVVALVVPAPWAAGMVWEIAGDGSTNPIGQLSQPAYADPYGDQIILPNTQYMARCWAANPIGAVAGSIYFDLYSPSQGLLAEATIPISSFSALGNFAIAGFNAMTPLVLPSDLVLLVYEIGLPAGDLVILSELELVYSQNPYNNTLVRASYAENPEGFAQTTGNLGASDDDSAVQCLALLRKPALLETIDGIHIFQDNDGEPDTWEVDSLTRAVGACSLRSGDPGKFGTGDAAEDWAVIASQNGAYLFAGGEFWKVSQEISRGALPQSEDPRPTWDDINWAAMQTIVVKNHPAKRRAYFALPLNGSATPNYVAVLDYREMDTATQIASSPPVHITIQGKMKSSDLTRKWSWWNVSANDLEILVRPSNVRDLFFAGGARNGAAYGNVYSLDPAKLTDDDYGQIFPYYTTYAFTDHDQEQALGLGSDLHLYKRLHAFIAGVGQVIITPIRNSLYNFQPNLSPRSLTPDTNAGNFLANDLEWSGLILRGQRVFFRVSVLPFPGATDVQIRMEKFIVAMMKDPNVQVRQSAV